MFGEKHSVPNALRSRVAYKLSCAGCEACYFNEGTRNFSSRI